MRKFSAKTLVCAAILVMLLGACGLLQPRSNSAQPEVVSPLNPVDAQQKQAATDISYTEKNEERTVRLPTNALTDPQIEEDDLRYALQLAEGGDREMALMISR